MTRRATLTSRVTREMQQKADAEALVQDERFLRFIFTTLSTAGMFGGNFHSEDAILQFREGRRSLGLDIIRTVSEASGRSEEQVLANILAAEIKTQEEVTHDRRNYDDDRKRDLDD